MNKKFEDVIAEQGRLVYTNVGDSMFPTIRDRDLLVIEAVRQPLEVGDVPLYKRDSGQYVLHRIVGIKRGSYLMRGDNRTVVEKGITDRHIIGVLTSIIRDGNTIPVDPPPEQSCLEYDRILKSLGNDDSKSAKRRLLKSRVFISGDALEKNYPFFAKHKALYPILLIYRPVKGAVTHPKRLVTEYKKIKRFKKKDKP